MALDDADKQYIAQVLAEREAKAAEQAAALLAETIKSLGIDGIAKQVADLAGAVEGIKTASKDHEGKGKGKPDADADLDALVAKAVKERTAEIEARLAKEAEARQAAERRAAEERLRTETLGTLDKLGYSGRSELALAALRGMDLIGLDDEGRPAFRGTSITGRPTWVPLEDGLKGWRDSDHGKALLPGVERGGVDHTRGKPATTHGPTTVEEAAKLLGV